MCEVGQMKSENDPNEDPNKKPIFQSAKLQDLNIAESILEGWEAWPPLVRNLTRRRRLRCSHPCHRHHRHHHRHHRHHHHHHYVDRLQAGRDSEEAEAQSPGALGQEGWNSHPRWSKSSWSQSVWLMVICRTMMTRRVILYSLDTSMRLRFQGSLIQASFFRTNKKISVKKCANRKKQHLQDISSIWSSISQSLWGHMRRRPKCFAEVQTRKNRTVSSTTSLYSVHQKTQMYWSRWKIEAKWDGKESGGGDCLGRIRHSD